jgi:hypothetical protein
MLGLGMCPALEEIGKVVCLHFGTSWAEVKKSKENVRMFQSYHYGN